MSRTQDEEGFAKFREMIDRAEQRTKALLETLASMEKSAEEGRQADSVSEKTSLSDDGNGDESSEPLFPGAKADNVVAIRKADEPKKKAPGRYNPFLVTFGEPGSVAAEQFRKLKAKIHRLNASRSVKTIMITSSTGREGKSFTAANLGVSIARENHNRALLIDCDLRNPTLTKWFGFENGEGLSEYIQGKGSLRELVQETGIERLRILPAGMAGNAPADLIASNKMKSLLNELKSQTEIEFVIVDSTPILATTEPEVLGALVDGIIVVVRAGVTPREMVEQAIASLEKEKILGVVLNDLVFKTSGHRSSYFGADRYYYRYGNGNGGGEMNLEENKRKKNDAIDFARLKGKMDRK